MRPSHVALVPPTPAHKRQAPRIGGTVGMPPAPFKSTHRHTASPMLTASVKPVPKYRKMVWLVQNAPRAGRRLGTGQHSGRVDRMRSVKRANSRNCRSGDCASGNRSGHQGKKLCHLISSCGKVLKQQAFPQGLGLSQNNPKMVSHNKKIYNGRQQ